MNNDRIEKYALVKCIGRGGMAEVWTGKSFGSGGFQKVVAIKKLSSEYANEERYQRALTDEALLAVQLKHPNIIDIYDLNLEVENPFMVMEYIEGTELRDLLKSLKQDNKKLTLSLAAYIITEVSKALSHAHERRSPDTGIPFRIVHRDVSPSNILISREGEVKLADFGIAKSAIQSAKTQVGEIKGKFRYMSPEQARAEPVDYHSDIYSLGLVFFECLFGRPAYEAEGDAELLKKAQTGEIKYPEYVDPALKKIIVTLLALKPQDRYSDLNSFRKDLGQYMLGHGGIIEREHFAKYLNGLCLPQIERAMAEKKHAEDWKPAPESAVIDETGHLSTARESFQIKRGKYYLLAGTVAIVIIIATNFITNNKTHEERTLAPPPAVSEEERIGEKLDSGTLKIETAPEDAIVEIRVGKSKFSKPSPATFIELPLNEEIKIIVSKKGYQRLTAKATLTTDKMGESLNYKLEKINRMKVGFMATPYAEVSIPGYFSDVETPVSNRKLPPGTYSVIFVHPPTQKRVTAHLSGHNGGSFVCTANMAVGDQSKPPSASCRRI